MSRTDFKSKILNRNQTGLFGFTSEGDVLFIRSHDSLQALDIISGRVIWNVQFEGDNIFGFKSIYLDNKSNVIVSVTDAQNNFYLQLLDSKTGNAVWRIPLGWSIHNNYGGILLGDEKIYFFEKGEEFYIKCISTLDGSEIMKNDTVEIKPSGKFQSKNKTTFLVKNYIFAQGKKHLIRFDLTDLSYSIVDDFYCNQFYATNTYLARINENSKSILISSIEEIDRVIGRIALPNQEEVISVNHFKIKNQDYLILRFSNSFRLALINIQKLEVVGLIDLPEYPIDCIYVDGKLAILCYTDEGNPIKMYDLEENEIVLNSDKGIIRGGLYNYENGFVFTSMNGLEMYNTKK
ncbi:MAG: hypothetical protein AAGA77_20075 [Bacteroidota bacterium]